MPQLFKRDGEESKGADRTGKVVIKIILQKTGAGVDFPDPGNRKEVVVVEDAKVGDVYKVVCKALFGDDNCAV